MGSCVSTSLPSQVDLNHFKFGRVIGRGGFGRVHVALAIRELETPNPKFLAIKRISKSKLLCLDKRLQQKINETSNKNPDDIDLYDAETDYVSALMLWTERTIMAHIRSPFLVPILHAFQTARELFLVMPCYIGGDLHTYLNKIGRMQEEAAKIYAAEIICALEKLHSHFYVYRDIKPLNLLLDWDGHLSLTDYGLCRSLSEENNFYITGRGGTRGYRAPEVFNGEEYDFSCDFYSLGVTLFELVTGSRKISIFHEECSKTEYALSNGLSRELTHLIKSLTQDDVSKRLGCELSCQRMVDRCRRINAPLNAFNFTKEMVQQRYGNRINNIEPVPLFDFDLFNVESNNNNNNNNNNNISKPSLYLNINDQNNNDVNNMFHSPTNFNYITPTKYPSTPTNNNNNNNNNNFNYNIPNTPEHSRPNANPYYYHNKLNSPSMGSVAQQNGSLAMIKDNDSFTPKFSHISNSNKSMNKQFTFQQHSISQQPSQNNNNSNNKPRKLRKDGWHDRPLHEIDNDVNFHWNAVKCHPWFSSIDWKKIANKQYKAPIIPRATKHELAAALFVSETDYQAQYLPADKEKEQTMSPKLQSRQQDLFKNFEFNTDSLNLLDLNNNDNVKYETLKKELEFNISPELKKSTHVGPILNNTDFIDYNLDIMDRILPMNLKHYHPALFPYVIPNTPLIYQKMTFEYNLSDEMYSELVLEHNRINMMRHKNLTAAFQLLDNSEIKRGTPKYFQSPQNEVDKSIKNVLNVNLQLFKHAKKLELVKYKNNQSNNSNTQYLDNISDIPPLTDYEDNNNNDNNNNDIYGINPNIPNNNKLLLQKISRTNTSVYNNNNNNVNKISPQNNILLKSNNDLGDNNTVSTISVPNINSRVTSIEDNKSSVYNDPRMNKSFNSNTLNNSINMNNLYNQNNNIRSKYNNSPVNKPYVAANNPSVNNLFIRQSSDPSTNNTLNHNNNLDINNSMGIYNNSKPRIKLSTAPNYNDHNNNAVNNLFKIPSINNDIQYNRSSSTVSASLPKALVHQPQYKQ